MTHERDDIIETLATHRELLRHTARGLDETQARTAATVSVLTVGGIIKHVSWVEARWARFAAGDLAAMDGDPGGFAASFVLGDDETLPGVLEGYREVGERTDALVRSLPDLDVAHPLPPAPWYAPGATRTARRVFLHIVAETAQHAGHADVVREAIDGQRTMG